ncbi:hypothetical protein [Pseudalkalibacillus caeni]|uniref:hypothetical protein n=1 Tax=Exobacillus caeni TaxID=2574798 RepID=UPI0014856EE4|nr:hypothetical protein [Pseudalkalibacillus caeni]
MPVESELPGVEINVAIASQFISNVKLIKQHWFAKRAFKKEVDCQPEMAVFDYRSYLF